MPCQYLPYFATQRLHHNFVSFWTFSLSRIFLPCLSRTISSFVTFVFEFSESAPHCRMFYSIIHQILLFIKCRHFSFLLRNTISCLTMLVLEESKLQGSIASPQTFLDSSLSLLLDRHSRLDYMHEQRKSLLLGIR